MFYSLCRAKRICSWCPWTRPVVLFKNQIVVKNWPVNEEILRTAFSSHAPLEVKASIWRRPESMTIPEWVFSRLFTESETTWILESKLFHHDTNVLKNWIPNASQQLIKHSAKDSKFQSHHGRKPLRCEDSEDPVEDKIYLDAAAFGVWDGWIILQFLGGKPLQPPWISPQLLISGVSGDRLLALPHLSSITNG